MSPVACMKVGLVVVSASSQSRSERQQPLHMSHAALRIR